MSRQSYWIIGAIFIGIASVTLYLVSEQARKVETTTVERRDVVEVYVATGRVNVRKISSLSSKVAGIVDEIVVSKGEHVRRGELLVKLRSRDAQLAIEKAKAKITGLRSQLNEIKRGATKSEIRSAKSEAEQFRSKPRQSKRELKRARKLFEDGVVSKQISSPNNCDAESPTT